MKTARENRSNDKMITMPTVNPHAAGIDLGSKSHFFCVAQDNVKEFGVFTSDPIISAINLLLSTAL